jgi:DNA-directed RNA polymerase subunit delta
MSNLTDHVSYIKGLAEGMKLDTNTNEGMMISKMLEVMAEMAQENAQLRKDLDELNEYVESIDDDLAEMEEALFGDEDEDDEDGDSCSCGHCHGHHDDEKEEDGDDDRVVEYTCPHCGEEMTFEVDNFDFDEDYLCPNCHQPLFPEEDEDEEKSEDEDKDDDQ